jgi:hypothetical protein
MPHDNTASPRTVNIYETFTEGTVRGNKFAFILLLGFLSFLAPRRLDAVVAPNIGRRGAVTSQPSVDERIAALDQKVADAQSAGDNAWMLTSAALVLLMTVAGLVAITPASGFVGLMPAMIIGLLAGVVCYSMVAVVKAKFGYDDSLDTFVVHGAGGTLGAILTGIFAVSAINPIFHDDQGHALLSGLIDGNPHRAVNQLVGVAIAWSIAIAGSIILLKVTDAIVGLRVSEDEEVQGLDLSQHGEIGYDFEP